MNNKENIRVGSIICWKGSGFLFYMLSGLLSLCDPTWRARRFKSWHMSFAYKQYPDGDWGISEATFPRVRNMPLSALEQIYGEDYKVYNHCGHPLSQRRVNKFVKDRLGAKYDAFVYVLTVIQYLFIKRFPRLIDGSYTCWEYAEEFCDCMGNPWYSTHTAKHHYPMIAEFLNEADKEKNNESYI